MLSLYHKNIFKEGKEYREEHNKLNAFLKANMHKKVLFLELGVGVRNQMIKAPFMNKGEVHIHMQIQDKAINVYPDRGFVPNSL